MASVLRSSFVCLTRNTPRSSRFITTNPRSFSTSTIRMTGLTGLLSNRYKLDDIPDLTGKVAVVTGGSRGIGEGLVAALAKKGCEVHILSATEEHAREAIEHITTDDPSAKSLLKHHTLDLGSLNEIKALIPTLAALPRIDLLFLIAGVGVAPFGLTKDGLGNHFAVNHLAGMLLADGLMPKLMETSKSKQSGDDAEKFSTRIVVESSELHRASPSDVKCESVEEFNTDMDATLLYGRSKLMGIWFIRELARNHLPALSSSTPIMALSVHPGAVATEQQKGATEAYGLLGKALETAANLGFMSKEQGAESACWAGTSSAVAERREEVQGRYFTEADGKVDTESNQAKDDELARKFWQISVKAIKDKADWDIKM